MARNPTFNLLFDARLGLSDIKIRVGTEIDESSSWVFPAHQLMLRASSPVFAAMLNGGYEETKKEVIVIEDISPNIFYRVWLYIYKGELQLQSISEACGVYRAADKYQIDNLKTACGEVIMTFAINWDIFWDLLPACLDDHSPALPFQLRLKVMMFLDKNAATVFKSKNFLFLSREFMTKIISRDSLQEISELVVCAAVAKWAEMQCFKTNVEPTAGNQRLILGDAFYKLKLTIIGKRDLISSPVYSMLTEQEITDIYQEVDSIFHSPSSTIPRCLKTLIQKGLEHRLEGHTCGTIYFVFAKDAFVHELSIAVSGAVHQIIVSTLNKGGSDSFVPIVQYDDDERLISFYAKAFVCYKLSVKFVERDDGEDEFNCLLNETLAYESSGTNTAVFFSINEDYVSDFSKFVSSDYWKNAFSTQEFEAGGCSTCIEGVMATFC